MRDDKFDDSVRRLFYIVRVLAERNGMSNDRVVELFEEAGMTIAQERTGIVADTAIQPEQVRLVSHMLALWSSDARYVNELGEMLALSERGDCPSLESLFSDAAEVYPDLVGSLTMDTAIELLKKNGALEQRDDGLFLAKSIYFRATESPSQALTDLTDFGETILYNSMMQEGRGLFQAVASVQGFPMQELGRLNGIAWDEGMEFLEGVDSLLVSEQKKHKGSAKEARPVGIGVYFMVRRGKEED